MGISRISPAAAGLLVVALTTPVLAGSPATDAFAANVRLTADFLAQSSRAAADRSKDDSLRAYARSEAEAMGSLVDEVTARQVPVAALADPMPVTVAANATEDGEMQSGRSAAIDVAVDAEALSPPPGTGALLPAAAIGLRYLTSVDGERFDALYKATQIGALNRLADLYGAYRINGDDPILRSLADRDLRAVNERIADLGRVR